jgi:hypothetical protein
MSDELQLLIGVMVLLIIFIPLIINAKWGNNE